MKSYLSRNNKIVNKFKKAIFSHHFDVEQIIDKDRNKALIEDIRQKIISIAVEEKLTIIQLKDILNYIFGTFSEITSIFFGYESCIEKIKEFYSENEEEIIKIKDKFIDLDINEDVLSNNKRKIKLLNSFHEEITNKDNKEVIKQFILIRYLNSIFMKLSSETEKKLNFLNDEVQKKILGKKYDEIELGELDSILKSIDKK